MKKKELPFYLAIISTMVYSSFHSKFINEKFNYDRFSQKK